MPKESQNILKCFNVQKFVKQAFFNILNNYSYFGFVLEKKQYQFYQ